LLYKRHIFQASTI